MYAQRSAKIGRRLESTICLFAFSFFTVTHEISGGEGFQLYVQ
jgi:hypothetical protein